MLKWLMNRLIEQSENKTGENADWLRDIARVSPRSFFVFGMFTPMAAHRRAMPLRLHHVARLAAVAEADCGPCFQTVVNYAVADGIDDGLIRSSIQGDLAKMTEDEAMVYRFAAAIAGKQADPADARTAIVTKWGEQALIDVAFAIAAMRVFPTVKRAMGYGAACQALDLKGEAVAPRQRLEAA